MLDHTSKYGLEEQIIDMLDYWVEEGRIAFPKDTHDSDTESDLSILAKDIATSVAEMNEYYRERQESRKVPGVAASEIAYALDRMTVCITKLTERVIGENPLKPDKPTVLHPPHDHEGVPYPEDAPGDLDCF